MSERLEQIGIRNPYRFSKRFQTMTKVWTVLNIHIYPSMTEVVAIRKEIRTWLGAVKNEQQYDEYLQIWLNGTCNWIFDSSAYINWASPDFSLKKTKLLWIHESAGYEKSVLCAKIIQFVMNTTTFALVYFFCSFNVETQQDLITIIRSWILQFVNFSQDAFNLIREKSRGKKAISASLFEIWELFKSIICCVPNFTLVVDEFDECNQSNDNWRTAEKNIRQNFLIEFKNSVAPATTRVLVISRDEVDIRSQMSPDLANPAEQIMYECRISKDDVQFDINLFSKSIVNRKLSNKNDAFRKELVMQMAEKCNEMFLWIKLQETNLRKGRNGKHLQQAIENMLLRLENAYNRDWRNISKRFIRDQSRALAVLHWVTFALRPLTILELTEALIVTEKDSCDDLQIDELPDNIDQDYIDDEITGLCNSLLEIRSTYSKQPLSFRTIHLIHFSVKQFLLFTTATTNRFTIDDMAFSDQISQNNHLAGICLRYLSYEITLPHHSSRIYYLL